MTAIIFSKITCNIVYIVYELFKFENASNTKSNLLTFFGLSFLKILFILALYNKLVKIHFFFSNMRYTHKMQDNLVEKTSHLLSNTK